MPDLEKAWIQQRVEGLTEGSEEVLAQADVYNSFNTWSALKLILLSAAVNMYTRVISKHRDDFFYIDALAGSGVSEYGDGQCFLGSAIVAAKAAAEPFSKMYFIEGKKEKKEALETRLDFVFNDPNFNIQEPEDWQVYHGDANDIVHDITGDMWKQATPDPSFNYFAFIDNQGLNFFWESMEELGDLTGDLLINYPAAQGVGMNLNNKAAHDGKLGEFFGRDMWPVQPKTRENYKSEYMKQLESLFDTGCRQVATKVDSGSKSYYYDIIYATRRTSRGSGYAEAIEYVKEFVEAVDGSDVEKMLRVMRGDQPAIEEFLPEESNIDESLLEDTSDLGDPAQSGLSDFR